MGSTPTLGSVSVAQSEEHPLVTGQAWDRNPPDTFGNAEISLGTLQSQRTYVVVRLKRRLVRFQLSALNGGGHGD